jgi:exonuclease SbcD
MRFIHMADMHFDAPFTVLANKKNLGNKRRLEQREVFRKAIEYIKEENIPFLFISGDLYEHNYVKKSTIEYINNLFKEIPNTKIFISPGNHDPFLKDSFYNNFNWNENVHIFNSEIENYRIK